MSDAKKHTVNKKPPSFGQLNRPSPLATAVSIDSTAKRKRSTAITLALLGTGAIGYLIVAGSARCQPNDPNQPSDTCRASSSSGGGYHGGSGGGSSSSTSTSGVTRGGFGATGHAVSGHAGS